MFSQASRLSQDFSRIDVPTFVIRRIQVYRFPLPSCRPLQLNETPNYFFSLVATFLTKSNTSSTAAMEFPQQDTVSFPTMARSSMGGITSPQYPPFQFTDDTLIHVAVHISPSPCSLPSSPSKLKKLKTKLLRRSEENVKVVRMPRSEYLRHFKLDNAGNYVGTEEERSWTAEELDQRYGKYSEWEKTRWVVGKDEVGRRVMVPERKIP